MGKECDACGGLTYTPANPRVFVCQQRPSDPSEMCCTIAGHKECFAKETTLPSIASSGGVATADQWEDWIESPEALAMGFLFLSL